MRDKSFTRIFTCLFHLLKFNICKSIKKCVLLGLPLYSDLKFNISFSGLKAEITLKINSSMLGFPDKLDFFSDEISSFPFLTSNFSLQTSSFPICNSNWWAEISPQMQPFFLFVLHNLQPDPCQFFLN